MNTPELTRDELLRLLADYCSGPLDEASAQRLADVLKTDADARRTFIEYVDMHSALAWECSSIADLDEVFLKQQRPAGVWPAIGSVLHRIVSTPPLLAMTVASLVLVVFLGALAFVPASLFQTRGGDDDDGSDPPDRIVAATITNTADCRWEESALPLGHGSGIYKGQQIELIEGAAEITFQSGAVVTLTGPATFVVDAQSKSTLRVGELSAVVPARAKGFAVHTPHAMVVDLGTEFGVIVTPESQEEVHVFQGEVDVSFPLGDVPAKRLGASEAVRITAVGEEIVVEELASSQRERFPSPIADEGDTTIAEALPADQHPPVTRGLTLWLAADGAIRTDREDRVIVWEDMIAGENSRAQNATQHNASRRPKLSAGAVGGKPALRFDGDDFLLLATPANLGVLGRPYEMFVVARTASPEIQFLIGGGVEDFEIHLNGDAGARFIPTGYAAGAGASDLRTGGAFSDGRAHLFAARVDPEGLRQGVLAVDGVETSDLTAGDARSVNNTSLRLGMRHNDSYGLRGEIAEVLLYRGELTAQERQRVSRYLAEKYDLPGT